jgi:phospholipid/cholesterol/gamma-HCH transport system permease protein
MITILGRSALRIVSELGDIAVFTVESLVQAFASRRLMRRVIRSLYELGIRCLPVVLVVGLFTGLVLGLQGYYVLNRFGSETILGTFVSLTLVRELAPVLAALMLTGQGGSALAAELGIQRNTEQINALETMGIPPLGYLVGPRILAALVVFPIMAALFTLVALSGGWLSGSVVLPVPSTVYWSGVFNAVQPTDVVECFIKSVTFGALVAILCAHNGYNTHRRSRSTGARAVSASTTRAVVVSSIMILAADFVITSLRV